jgi:hypothetical protein
VKSNPEVFDLQVSRGAPFRDTEWLVGIAAVGTPPGGAFEVRIHGLGAPQLADYRSRAVAVPVLVVSVAVGLEVANENVLGADGDVLVAPRTLVELARNAEGQNDDIVVEVHSPQTLSSTRQTGLVHRGSLVE